jgi:hypothetical protein
MSRTFDAGDLLSPETYARESKGLHAEVRAYREQRTVHIGPNAALMFEDASTVRYQLQETLRMESISEDVAVQAEIDAYSFLIPDGSNFKATFELGFADANERHARTAELIGVEAHVWMQVEGFARTFAVAGSSLERAEANRIPAVRYLRFELDKARVRELKKGARLLVGIDHPAYRASLALAEDVRRLLLQDLR